MMMKQLQLKPPLIIITMGYPGSGTTFFARQFADQYLLPRISEDRIRFELFENPQFSIEEDEIIHRIQLYAIEELMQTNQVIVCEGSFLSNSIRQEIRTLAASQGYRTLTVWLQTDVDTSFARASRRDKRALDNKYSFAITKNTFGSIRTRLEKPDEKEPSIVISGKHAFKSQCLTVLRKITASYSDSIAKGDFTVKQEPPVTRKPLNLHMSGARRIIQ